MSDPLNQVVKKIVEAAPPKQTEAKYTQAEWDAFDTKAANGVRGAAFAAGGLGLPVGYVAASFVPFYTVLIVFVGLFLCAIVCSNPWKLWPDKW